MPEKPGSMPMTQKELRRETALGIAFWSLSYLFFLVALIWV